MTFLGPDTPAAARAELEERRGEGFGYRSVVGHRPPPLDDRS